MNLKNLYIELIKYYNFQFLFGEYRNKIIALDKEGSIEIIRYPPHTIRYPPHTKTGKISESFDYKNYEINIKLKK